MGTKRHVAVAAAQVLSPVVGDCGRPAVGMPKELMATFPAHLNEAQGLEEADHFPGPYRVQARQAQTSTC
jgi:hypothetical protein